MTDNLLSQFSTSILALNMRVNAIEMLLAEVIVELQNSNVLSETITDNIQTTITEIQKQVQEAMNLDDELKEYINRVLESSPSLYEYIQASKDARKQD